MKSKKLPIQGLTTGVEKASMKKFMLAFTLTLVGSSCGLLGNKKPVERILNVQNNVGCLDNLGPQFNKYVDGEISPFEWEETFKCMDNTLNTFTQFVAGNDPEGYNQADVKALTEQFIITQKPVTLNFVRSVFELKSSLFGGKVTVITKGEIAEVRRILTEIRVSSTKLIPHLWNRKHKPEAQNMREFIGAVQLFGAEVARTLNTEKNPTLTKESVAQFLDELSKISFSENKKDLKAWAEFITEIKVTLIGGDTGGIGPRDWKPLLTLGTELGASLAAYFTMNPSKPNEGFVEDNLFTSEVVYFVRDTLKRQMEQQGGGFAYNQIKRVIDNTPNEILPPRAQDFKNGVKKYLEPRVGKDGKQRPPGLTKLLTSGSNTHLNVQALERFVEIFVNGTRGDHHLNQIMSGQETLTRREFADRANRYSQSLSKAEKTEIERLVIVANRHQGMHKPTEKEFFYGPRDRHSRTNLSKFSWYHLVADRLLSAYGSKTVSTGRAGTRDDLLELTDDAMPILSALSMIHPDKKEVHKKRFREANLFTPSGNGDNFMDIIETTDYLSYLFSITGLSKRIDDDILIDDDSPNAPCAKIGWDDKMQLPTYDVRCFREHYSKNLESYFRQIPDFWKEVSNYSDAQLKHFHKQMETASKFTGYNEDPITSYDVDSYAGVVHYVEETMKKFDRRGGVSDGVIDRFEALEYAWPVFRIELLEFLPIKWNYVGQKMLIYLMQKGQIPFACMSKPKASEILKLLWWWISGGHKDWFEANRLRVVYILAVLSMPATPSCPASKATVRMASNGQMIEDLPEGWKPFEETLELLNQPQ